MNYKYALPWCVATSTALLSCANETAISGSAMERMVAQGRTVDVLGVSTDFEQLAVIDGMVCKFNSDGRSLGDTAAKLTLPGVGSSAGTSSLTGSSITTSNQALGEKAYAVSEVLYRVCEFSANYDLSKSEAILLL